MKNLRDSLKDLFSSIGTQVYVSPRVCLKNPLTFYSTKTNASFHIHLSIQSFIHSFVHSFKNSVYRASAVRQAPVGAGNMRTWDAPVLMAMHPSRWWACTVSWVIVRSELRCYQGAVEVTVIPFHRTSGFSPSSCLLCCACFPRKSPKGLGRREKALLQAFSSRLEAGGSSLVLTRQHVCTEARFKLLEYLKRH